METTTTPTPTQVARVQVDLAAIAGEPVKVEFVKGHMYVYGSELAVLRIFYRYRVNPGARAEFSRNLNTWYFTVGI